MMTQDDMKYWFPLEAVLQSVGSLIPEGAKVLEIGPGRVPFSKATHFIDVVPGENKIMCDVQRERIPFDDKYFDFIYCRHVVEDLEWPFPALQEMSRVAKAGYIETPSPMAEYVRGVDGNKENWRGYVHHQWFVWTKDGVLNFLKKYPCIEYTSLPNEAAMEQMLRTQPLAWNNYHLWTDEIKFADHYLNNIKNVDDISNAVVESINSSRAFIERFAK